MGSAGRALLSLGAGTFMTILAWVLGFDLPYVIAVGAGTALGFFVVFHLLASSTGASERRPTYDRDGTLTPPEPPRESFSLKPHRKQIGIIVAALVALIIVSQSYIIVPAGNRGIVLTLGKVTGVATEGFSLKAPFITSVELMDIKVQRTDRNDESSGTKDLQEVSVDVSVNYQLNAELIDTIYRTLGKGYDLKVIQPNIDEGLKAVTADYTAEQLITLRENVKADLLEVLREKLLVYGIEVMSVSFTDFQFSDIFTAAIEAKVTAQQKALEAQNKLEQVRFEEQQKIIIATAEANATLTKANADAQAQVIRAQAESESIRLVREQLGLDPQSYLAYINTLKWNGVLPLYTGGNIIPFLDLNMTNPK